MKPLIGICGEAGVGKSTLAAGIAGGEVVFTLYNFADPVYDAVGIIFGYGPAQWKDHTFKDRRVPMLKNISNRMLLQTLGTDWGRDMIDEDIWLKLAQKKYERNYGGMILADLRFNNEAAWIRDAGGIVLDVTRPGHNRISESSHASEQGIDEDYINAFIVNEGEPRNMIDAARRIVWASFRLQAD